MSGTLKPLYTAEALHDRVCAMAREIDIHYGNEPVVLICVLKGAYLFFADLSRAITAPNVELDFVRIASYGMEKETNHQVRMVKDVELSLKDKHVLVVEDIIDTGHSIRFLLKHFDALGAKSCRVAVLINKSQRREVEVTPDFVGVNLSDGFIVGYGLDYAEKYRNLPGIYELEA